MLALLCSVQPEAGALAERISGQRTRTIGSKLFVEGTLGGRRTVLCIGGMGKVNAAHAATLAIERFQPEALVIFGIGGAYPSSGAQVGDVVLARNEVAGDEGVLTHEGFKDTEYLGIPLLKLSSAGIYNSYPAPGPLVEKAAGVLAPQAPRVGTFVTLSTCTGTTARARELEERYGGLCENMEGAAAAHVALAHGVPWLEVRGISNIVQDRDLASWEIPRAAAAAQRAVAAIVEAW
jgi:futalosine hydrolase